MVIWLTGISGSGKTTVARELLERFAEEGQKPVWIDGDEFREIFLGELSLSRYSIKARRKNGLRIFRLVSLLDRQGFDVVVSVISLFPDLLSLNRITFDKYLEVRLIASLDLVQKRDPKGLYARNVWNSGRRVVGWGVEYLPPATPDLEIVMDGDPPSPSDISRQIFAIVKRNNDS